MRERMRVNRRWKGGIANERGVALVETALIMIATVFILAAVIDLGLAFDAHIVVGQASYDGARYASLHSWDESGTKAAAVQAAANNGLAVLASNVTVVGVGGTGGEPIRVVVTYDYPTVLGGMLGWETILLRNATEMVIQGAIPYPY